jgi:hypothetical protein
MIPGSVRMYSCLKDEKCCEETGRMTHSTLRSLNPNKMTVTAFGFLGFGSAYVDNDKYSE